MSRKITITLANGLDKRIMILSADINQKLGSELYQKVFLEGITVLEKQARGKKT